MLIILSFRNVRKGRNEQKVLFRKVENPLKRSREANHRSPPVLLSVPDFPVRDEKSGTLRDIGRTDVTNVDQPSSVLTVPRL